VTPDVSFNCIPSAGLETASNLPVGTNVGPKQMALLTLASHSNSDVGTESQTSYTQRNKPSVSNLVRENNRHSCTPFIHFSGKAVGSYLICKIQ